MTTQAPRPLSRRLGLLGVLFLTLSAATPASSLFVIVPDVIRQAGTGALLAMALAALVAAGMSAVYAELASAFPYAGGEYAIAGRVLGPRAAFAVLAVNLLNSVLTAAVFALGVAEYLHAAWPSAPSVGVALAVVAGACGVGLLNVRAGGGLTGAFLGLELGAVVAVAVAGFAHPERGLGALLAHPLRADGPAGAGAIVLAASVALFAYDGYGSAVYFAEELERPRERVAKAVMLALLATVLAELPPVAAVLTGAHDLKALFAAPDMLQALVGERLGAGVRAATSLAVALALANAAVAMVLLSARQVYALARDGVWPGERLNRALTATGTRSGAPTSATLAVSAAAAGLCLLPLHWLLVLTGTGITLIYAALCVALLAGRRRGRLEDAAWRSPAFPLLPLALLLALAGVLVTDALDAGEGRPSLFVTLAIGAAGAAWGGRAAGRGRWRLTAPEDEG